jgi:hypothetical protein
MTPTRKSRKLVAFLADTHAGHKLGLMPPGVELLDDSGPEPRTWTPPLTAIQEWLWMQYVADMGAVWALAGKAPVTLVHGGDVTWGARFPTQLVSTRLSDQLLVALGNLLPWYEHKGLRSVVLVQGTESHEFGEGSAPIALAEQLVKRFPKVSTTCTRHALLSIDGLLVDVAHHGPGVGGRAWLTGNELRYYTRSILMDDIVDGRKPPDVIVRAHYHHGIRETVRVGEHTCEAFVLPAYCGMTHYSSQVTRSAYMLSCGLVALEIVDGKVQQVHPFWRRLDLRQTVEV